MTGEEVIRVSQCICPLHPQSEAASGESKAGDKLGRCTIREYECCLEFFVDAGLSGALCRDGGFHSRLAANQETDVPEGVDGVTADVHQ